MLVGFLVARDVALIVWAVIEVIPLGSLTDEKDLAPDMQPGDYEGWDFQIDGLTFSQGPRRICLLILTRRSQPGWRMRRRSSSRIPAKCRWRSFCRRWKRARPERPSRQAPTSRLASTSPGRGAGSS